jgi:hypothetical protein
LIQGCFSTQNPYRLSKASLGLTDISMNLMIFDWDLGEVGTKVVPTPEQRQEMRAKIHALPCKDPVIYDTFHGMRFLYLLEQPRILSNAVDCARWTAEYECALEVLKEHGIVCDETCSEPFKIFRLAFGKRNDATPEKIEAAGEMKLDLPEEIGYWNPALTDEQLARIASATVKSYKKASGETTSSLGASNSDIASTILYKLFYSRGWIITDEGNRALVECPYAVRGDHASGAKSSTALFSTDLHSLGTWRCLHQTCKGKKSTDLLKEFFTHVVFEVVITKDNQWGTGVKFEDGREEWMSKHPDAKVKASFKTLQMKGRKNLMRVPLKLAENKQLLDYEMVDTDEEFKF